MDVDPAVASALRHRSFSVRSVLNRAFRVWFTSLHRLLAIGVVFLSPLALLALIPGDGKGNETRADFAYLGALPLTFLMQGAIIAFVFQRLLGQRPQVFASIRAGLSRTLAVVGVVIFTGAAIGALAIVVFMLSRAISPFFGLLNLLSIPLFIAWSVAIPVAVVEKLPATKAIARSVHLTRSSRLKIFGAYVLLTVLAYAIEFVTLLPILLATRGTTIAASPWTVLVALIVVASFFSVVPAVVYHELRETKEGIGLDQLASVFQ
jgi:hypothetical protein